MNQEIKLVGCLLYGLAALIVASAAAFFALTMAGFLGGVGIGVAPEPTFNLVKPIICPGEGQLQYYSIERSYHEPGEGEPHLECIVASNESTDVLLPGILAVLASTFVVTFSLAFAGVFLPLAILLTFLLRRYGSEN